MDDELAFPVPVSSNPGALTNALLASSGPSRLIGFTVYSSKNANQFVLVFDSATIPADNAVPLFVLPILTQNQTSAYYGHEGRVFYQGIVVCNSTTDTTKTIGSKDCFIDVQWKPL